MDNDADQLIASRVAGIMNNEILALRALIHRLETPPYEWPADDILAVVQDHRSTIVKYIDRKFRVGNISLPINDIKKLAHIGAEWPELKEMISKYKFAIVKKLLDILRDDHTTAVDPINTLTSLNMRWPELVLMQKSIDERTKQLQESYTLDDHEMAQYKADLLSDIHGNHYIAVIDAVPDITRHENIGDVDSITRALDEHKHGIMRALLEMIKLGSSNNLSSYGPDLLNGFAKLGIAWPELDVIRTSIAKTPTTELSENRDHAKWIADEYRDGIVIGVLRNDMDLLFQSLAEFSWTDPQDLDDVSDLTTLMTNHKQRIMKGLREYMLGLDPDGICYIIPQILDGLRIAGINWPDLKVLEQSVDLMQQEKDKDDDLEGHDELNERRKTVNNIQESHGMIPREIRYTLRMFYEDIEQGSYIDAVECLNELYHYKVYETAERDRINAALQDHKTGIVKRLLRYMRRYPSDEVAHFIPNVIEALRAFDINWPDLNVIATSVSKKKSVAEALGSPLGNIVFGMQNALRQGNDNVVAHRLINLWRGDLDERQRASDMLLDVKELLLNWAERYLSSSDPYDVQDALNLFRVLPPSGEWAELQHLLTTYKKHVVKYLMKCMQEGDFDIVEDRVTNLHDWGINWPDLEVLKKGADEEIKNNLAKFQNLDEADSRADFSTVFRNRSEEAGGHRFLLNADEYVDHISTLLQSGWKDDNAVIELATVGRRRRDAIKNWPELAELINNHKTQLLDIITYHFNKENFGSHAATRSIDTASALHDIGVNWPEIAPLIKKNKHKIIKTLLEMIQDDFDEDYIIHEINALKSYGVNWPELEIINKTIVPDKLTEDNDQAAAVSDDSIRSMIMGMLERDGLGIALYHIEEWRLDVEKLPELKDFLNKRKHQYMKIMINDLKDGRDWKYGAVNQYLGRLEKSKINWPDLEIIRDSLNTLQKQEDNTNDN